MVQRFLLGKKRGFHMPQRSYGYVWIRRGIVPVLDVDIFDTVEVGKEFISLKRSFTRYIGDSFTLTFVRIAPPSH